MSGRKSFDELRAGVDADTVRRARVEGIKHAMRDVLALSQLREERGLTQRELAEQMRVTQANISRVEHQEDLYLSTLRNYVEALGGRLEVHAVFDDQTVDLDVGEPEVV